MRRLFFSIKIFFGILFFSALIFAFSFFTKEYGLKKSSILIPLNTSADRNEISVKTYIGKNSYPFIISTGSKLPCIINREDFEEFQNRKEIGIEIWHQLNGEEFKAPKYLMERIDLETVPIVNTSYVINTAAHLGFGELGILGAPIFRQYDYWLFDFPKSRLYLVKDKKKFKKCFRISFKRFIKHSLEPLTARIIFKVNTEFGEKNLALMAGLKNSYMRMPPGNFVHGQKLKLQKLEVNGQTLESPPITLVSFPDIFVPDDGGIGMDFLKNRVVFVDFKDNKIFIGPNETLPKEDKVRIRFS